MHPTSSPSLRLHASFHLHHQHLDSGFPALIPITPGNPFCCDSPSDSNWQIPQINNHVQVLLMIFPYWTALTESRHFGGWHIFRHCLKGFLNKKNEKKWKGSNHRIVIRSDKLMFLTVKSIGPFRLQPPPQVVCKPDQGDEKTRWQQTFVSCKNWKEAMRWTRRNEPLTQSIKLKITANWDICCMLLKADWE